MGLTRLKAEQISDIDYKQAVRVITVTDIANLSGGAPSQVDGVNLTAGDRILVTAQDPGSENGIYQVQTAGSGSNGTWIRSLDTNATGELEAGTIVMVTEGNIYADTQWKLTTNNPIVIGTTPLTFEQNSAYAFGNIYANGTAVLANSVGSTVTLTAGNNIAITGNNSSKTVTIAVTGLSLNSISNGTSNVNVVSSGGNVTVGVGGTANVTEFSTAGVQVLGRISATGNITGNFFIGNGSQLTGIAGGGGTPGGDNTNIQFNDAGSFGGTAGLTFNKTTNAVATTGTFSATGNVTGGNLIAGTGASGNITGANVITANTVTITANITGGNILTGGLISATGAITGAALTGTSLTVGTGNITSGNLLLSGAIVDSAQLDIQTSAANANIVLTPNGTGNVNMPRLSVSGNVIAGNVTATNLTGTLLTASQTNITAVGTLGSLSVTGNVQGGNLRTAGLISATGAITGGAITGTSLTVGTGNLLCGNIQNNNGNGVGNIGNATGYFNTVFAKATSAQYADLAEMYVADADYVPGTLVEFGGVNEVAITTQSHSTRVAGIVSTNPSYLMNATQSGNIVVPVALTGRVPCYVFGNISKGDRLVSSNISGVAQLLDMTKYQPGCIIGKALEDYNSQEIGRIEVAVGRF